jgi:hypothetical protein
MVGGGSPLASGAAAALLEVNAADFGAWERSAAHLAAIGGGNRAHSSSAVCLSLPGRCMGTLLIAADARRKLALASTALVEAGDAISRHRIG